LDFHVSFFSLNQIVFFQFLYIACVLLNLCYCCIVGGCCTSGFVVMHWQLLINVSMHVWF
jgi:hypothetical protein